MADDPQQKLQTQTQGGGKPEGANGTNGHAPAKFPANGTETHDGSKYAEKKEGDAGKDGSGAANAAVGKKPASPLRKVIVTGVIAAAVIAAVIWGISYYNYSQNHVSTDDAYVTGNLVNVSPIISGTLNSLTVDEGVVVKQGQLIGRIEDSGQRASLAQSQAAYQSALSQLPQAEQNLAYQQQATNADIRKAQAGLAAQQAKTTGAQQQVILSRNQVLNQVQQATSQISQAKAQAAQYDAQVQTARAAVNSQQQTVRTAQRAADAADATIRGAQANAQKATNDAVRYAKLVKQQAVTEQQNDAAVASADSAQSNLDATRFQAAQAHSQVRAAQANVEQAVAQLKAAQRAADAAGQNVEVARAGLGIARANLSLIPIDQSNVLNNVGQNQSALADLSTAQAGKTQIQVRKDEIRTFQANANSALAQLHNAQVIEGDTNLYAPNDGTVVKKAVNIGASLAPGQTIVTITQGDYVYVTANFKETQLGDVKPNESAEVEVDSYPGKVFHGYVGSINEATGATQALLPPDNATGNFTKVVQRIPVRIELRPAKPGEDKKFGTAADIAALRQGSSVTATIDTSTARQNH
ncbi:MAG: efflux RND transporter periplasmic adaptor subunit [Janthinobacterium lividum]